MRQGSNSSWAESVVGRIDGSEVGALARGLFQRVGLSQGSQPRDSEAKDPRVVQLSGGFANRPERELFRGDESPKDEDCEAEFLLSPDHPRAKSASPIRNQFWADFNATDGLGDMGHREEEGWRGLVRKAGGAVRPLYENAVEVAHNTATAASTAAKNVGQQVDGAKIAALGQQVIDAAKNPWQNSSPDSNSPSKAPILKFKQADIPAPSTEKEWAECLRDLERMLQGDGVFVAAHHRLSPIITANRRCGDIDRAARAAAFEELSEAISNALEAHDTQDEGRRFSDSVSRADSVDSIGAMSRSPKPKQKVQSLTSSTGAILPASVKRELARRVATHLSVVPGMQVTLQNDLPPALWQPTFLLCVGGGQVRVVTFAFVGEPVSGDRPDCKYTPHVLRLITEDLLPGARQAAAGIPTPWRAIVRCQAEQASDGIRSILQHIASVEEDLFPMVESGDWGRFVVEEPQIDVASAHESKPPVRSSTSFASATYGTGGL